MHHKRLAAGVAVLISGACLACSAQQGPTTEVLTPEQVEEMKVAQAGALAGIGAKLDKTDGQLVIKEVFSGSPAEKAGLNAGLVITAINGIPVKTMQLTDALKLIRGPKGSTVELTGTESSSATTTRVTIVRDIITVPAATGRILDGNIGLLTIASFTETTPKTVISILRSFATNGVQGVVLDLRSNGGGSLSATRDVAGMFVGRKPILWLSRMTKDKRVDPVRGTGESLWQGPLVALVDRYTASAGELLASALQTSKHTKVVGQTTYGRCSITSIEPQPDGSAKKVVIGYMLTAGGDPIDGIGIKPDVPLDANLSKEEALRKAVEALSRQKDEKLSGAH